MNIETIFQKFEKRRKMKVVILLLSIILIIYLINFTYNLWRKGYTSYKLRCLIPEQIETYTNCGLIDGYYDVETDQIFIRDNLEGKERVKTIKHEECHRQQTIDGKLVGCNKPFRYILNEMACYLSED